jgi:hypothetical protein
MHLLALMAPSACRRREGLLSIMTGAAAFTLVHVRHRHFRAAFFHGEEIRMALIACEGGMAGVTEIRG